MGMPAYLGDHRLAPVLHLPLTTLGIRIEPLPADGSVNATTVVSFRLRSNTCCIDLHATPTAQENDEYGTPPRMVFSLWWHGKPNRVLVDVVERTLLCSGAQAIGATVNALALLRLPDSLCLDTILGRLDRFTLDPKCSRHFLAEWPTGSSAWFPHLVGSVEIEKVWNIYAARGVDPISGRESSAVVIGKGTYTPRSPERLKLINSFVSLGLTSVKIIEQPHNSR